MSPLGISLLMLLGFAGFGWLAWRKLGIVAALAPDARRANVPLGWAWPAFDVLQLEDYDWVIEGRFAAQQAGLGLMQQRLGYPLAQQHYMTGFVLLPQQADVWCSIAQAADLGKARGVAEILVWALPQVTRDGFVYFDLDMQGDAAMQAFDDVSFPLPIGRDAQSTSRFSTQIFRSVTGHETRNSLWADAALSFDVGPGVRSEADCAELLRFFRARRGPARGFRLRDPLDHSSAEIGNGPHHSDQILGEGDGVRSDFALIKHYGDPPDGQQRPKVGLCEILLQRPGRDYAELRHRASPCGCLRIASPSATQGVSRLCPNAGATINAYQTARDTSRLGTQDVSTVALRPTVLHGALPC